MLHVHAAQVERWVTPPPAWSARRLSEGCDFSGGARECGSRVDSRGRARNAGAGGMGGGGMDGGGAWHYGYTDTFGWMHAAFLNGTHARLHTEMVSGTLGDVFWIVRGP